MLLNLDDFIGVNLGGRRAQHDEDLPDSPEDGHSDNDGNEDVTHGGSVPRTGCWAAQILSIMRALARPPPSHIACSP